MNSYANQSNRPMNQKGLSSYNSPVCQPAAIFGGMQFIYVSDPMVELATCPSLLIRQEPEFLEAISGCEQPNIYHIFGNSQLGFRYLFKCIEKLAVVQDTFALQLKDL